MFKSGNELAYGGMDNILDSLGGWEQLQIIINARNLKLNRLICSMSFEFGFEEVWQCEIRASLFYFYVSLNGGNEQIVVHIPHIKSYIEMTTNLSLSF